MIKIKKILFVLISISILFSIFSISSVIASQGPPDPIPSEQFQWRVLANNRTQFMFQQQTRLTFNCNVNVDLHLNCDSSEIGAKNFEIQIDSNHDLQMNMTCTEEQVQLGLQKGHTLRNQHRNRYRYQEGFCVSIECNDSCQAKLMIQANNRNRNGQWAYYHEGNQEWVTVPTELKNGSLVCETNHFSVWTIIIPESEGFPLIYIYIGVIVGVIVVIGIIIFLVKRK